MVASRLIVRHADARLVARLATTGLPCIVHALGLWAACLGVGSEAAAGWVVASAQAEVKISATGLVGEAGLGLRAGGDPAATGSLVGLALDEKGRRDTKERDILEKSEGWHLVRFERCFWDIGLRCVWLAVGTM